AATGMVLYAPNLRWRNVPLGARLQAEVGMPVLLENDANAAVYGEYWCGTTRGVGDGVFIFADFGVGSGFLVDGEVYRGRDQAAGEFGHTTIDMNGPRCHCGNRGCLGTLASGLAVLRKVREAVNGGLAIGGLEGLAADRIRLDDVLAAAKGGDPFCLAAIWEAAVCLGVGIANLINVYNPASLVIGGRMAAEAPGYWETAASAAAERLYPAFGNQVHLALSTLGPDVLAIGAGSLVIRQLFIPLRITVPN
ncbi:MAG TPA: ROK family protein, partial [Symbiobacteriaceae bacterium]|nr:ROK family protein [Symbiobacteriaceae bacterium]